MLLISLGYKPVFTYTFKKKNISRFPLSRFNGSMRLIPMGVVNMVTPMLTRHI